LFLYFVSPSFGSLFFMIQLFIFDGMEISLLLVMIFLKKSILLLNEPFYSVGGMMH